MGEAELLEIRIQLEKLITEREAMVAENQWRISQQETLAYGDMDFARIREQMEALLIELRRAQER